MSPKIQGENDGVRALAGYFLFVLATVCAVTIAAPPALELFDAIPGSVQVVVILVGLLSAIGGSKAFETLRRTRNRLIAGLSFVIMAILMALALIGCVYKNETEGSDTIWRDGLALSLFALAFGVPGLSLVLHRRDKQSPQIL